VTPSRNDLTHPTSAPVARSRGLALAVLCAMQLMIVLDGTIVTVALPTIQRDLDFSQAGLSWVLNSYLIAFAGLLLLAGRLGDLLGSKRMFVAGLTVFTAASLLCGVAGSRELLITGRFAQGVGGALASAVILGMIVRLYPDPHGQGRAIGMYSFISAAGASIGLLGGGVITQLVGWHGNFLINLPIGVVALVAAARLFTTDHGVGLGAGADIVGAVLVTTGLSLGVYSIVRVSDLGWGSGQTLASGAAALILLAAFVARQATAGNPILPLRVLRTRQVFAANLIVVAVFAAAFGFQFLNALYLQRVFGYDPMHTGLAFLPTPVTIGVVSLGFAPRLIARFGARAMLLTGLLGVAAGLLALSRAPVDGSYAVDILPVLVVMGSGMGLAIPAVMMLAMSGTRPEDAGLASGLVNTTQQAGSAIGLAVLATLATARTDTLLDAGTETMAALNGGYHLAFRIAAGFVVVGMVIALTLLKPKPATPPTSTKPPEEAPVAG